MRNDPPGVCRTGRFRGSSGYARKAGHRQLLTMLEITEVKLPAKRVAATKKDAAAASE